VNRRAFGGAGVWLASVAAVAGISWVAIDSAGRQVTSADTVTLPTKRLTGTGSSRVPVRTSASGSGSASRSGSGSVEQGESGEPGDSAEPGVSPQPGGSWQPGGSATSGPSPAAGSRTGTQATSGGAVTMVCRGEEVVRWWAQPLNGWHVEDRSPSTARTHVEVEFTGSAGQGELRIVGRCIDSLPSFTVTVYHDN